MATVILFGNTVLAQKDFGDLGLPTVTNEMPPFAGISSGPGVQYQATFKVEQDSNRGQIIVTADIAPGHHTYSTTQPSGGPTRTTIELKDDFVKVTGPFVPDRDPEIGFDEESWPGLPIEEYYDQISWTAEIEFTKELEFENTELQLEVDGLVCEESCMPVGGKYKAEFAGFYGEQPKATSLRVEATHAVWNAKLSPATVTPGGIAIISVTAKNDTGYHVYEFVPGDEETTFRTLIVGKTKSGLKFGTPTTDAAAEPYPGFEEVSYHNGTVTWQIPVYVPDSAIQGEFPLEVLVGFGTCNDRGCDEPKGLAINGTLTVGGKTEKTSADLLLAAMSFNDVADSPMLASWIDGDTVDQLAQSAVAPEKGERADQPKQSLTAFHLLAALVGGFILNFMPCVLPVIGLKVMSFASQAGNSHSRIVALNLAYVAGILAVMLVLAWITIAAKALSGNAFGWGEQFTHLEFKVALAALVFAMALSFLGVWEIPIPGFATTTKSGELMQKEGLTGAFLKGVLTTILATPCSGPLLGSLFGLSLVLSATSVLILYTAVGIGLAFPFFALCIWPGSIKMLPKPGPWMETLKQALAFPLLLTVVFFVSSIGSDHRIATLILLIVVWFACWLIGKVPAYSDKSTIWKTWGAAIATIAVGAFVSFSFFGPFKSDLPWVPYSETQLAKYRQEGKTVMLDFTANWCLTCQVNTRVAIDKVRVAQLVEENQVVPMLADWTDKSDAIRNKLEELQSNSIPLLVIYPPDPDAEPILLRDSLTESQVLNALEEAGPSRIKTKLTSSQVD